MTDIGPIPIVLYRRGAPSPADFPLVAAGLVEGGDASSLPETLRAAAAPALLGDFRGEEMETALVYAEGGGSRLLLLGLGKEEKAGVRLLRRWAARASKEARRVRVRRLALVLPPARGIAAERIAAAAEGAVLGARLQWMEKDRTPLDELAIFGEAPEPEGAAAVEAGLRTADATLFARVLAMEPPNRLAPADLAAAAERIAAEERGVSARIWSEKEIEREGLLSLLAVGSGSANPPRFIRLAYDGAGARANDGPIVLVGKGITFDSGGLSLKAPERMAHMKYDMSGAAAVLAAVRAAARLRLPLRVVAVVPSAENMPGPRSYRPGDVLQTYKGLTIEVDNTDAEGRIVLADAIAWAEKNERPDSIVDVATLTGAIRIALGRHAAGLFSNDDALADEIVQAAGASGERIWRLPLWEEYDAEIKSDIADVRNIARSAEAGGAAIVAAKFLERFAGGARWAHLDIAGRAWAQGEHPLGPAGPTGFGAALLLSFLRRRAAARSKGENSK